MAHESPSRPSWPRPQYSVARCEAFRGMGATEELKIEWEISPLHFRGAVLALGGFLAASNENGRTVAQVIALMELPEDAETEVSSLVDELEDAYVIENMYDLARRTASAQAALCDWWPQLPSKAPEHSLTMEYLNTADDDVSHEDD